VPRAAWLPGGVRRRSSHTDRSDQLTSGAGPLPTFLAEKDAT